LKRKDPILSIINWGRARFSSFGALGEYTKRSYSSTTQNTLFFRASQIINNLKCSSKTVWHCSSFFFFSI
jgi:hypothetical protein